MERIIHCSLCVFIIGSVVCDLQAIDNKVFNANGYGATYKNINSQGTCLTDCQMQSEFKPACPSTFIESQDLCLQITKPQQWSDDCPFMEVLNFTQPKYLRRYNQMDEIEVWLPVRRTKRYGMLVWTHPKFRNLIYRHPLLRDAIENSSSVHDCVIATNINATIGTYVPKMVDCSLHYPTVCMYKLRKIYETQTNDRHCSNYNTGICYFKKETDDPIRRTDYCTQLAEPVTPEDNFIVKNIADDDKCWFGLEKDANGLLQWPTTHEQLNCSDWESDTKCQNFYGVVSEEGWNLQNSGVKCGICQEKNTVNKSRLTLKSNLNNLVLIVHSAYIIHWNCIAYGVHSQNVRFKSKKYTIKNEDADEKILEKFKNEYTTIYILKPDYKHHTYYWCEGISVPDKRVVKTHKVLFGLEKLTQIYAVQILIQSLCVKLSDCDIAVSDFHRTLSKNIESCFDDNDIEVDVSVMDIISVSKNGTIQMLLHIRTKHQKPSIEEMQQIKDILNNQVNYTNKLSVLSLKSSSGCLAITTTNNGKSLHWAFTTIDTTILPQEICIGCNGIPVTRTCLGDFMYGSHWSLENGRCCKDIKYSNTTKKLHELFTNETAADIEKITTNLQTLISRNDELISSDLYYVSKILEDLIYSNATYTNRTGVLKNTASLMNYLILKKQSVLKLSNRLLNSTNKILDAFDRIAMKLFASDLDDDGFVRMVTPYFVIQISDPTICNITGLAIIERSPNENNVFTDYDLVSINANATISELLDLNNLKMATYVPEALYDRVNNESNVSNSKVFIALFYNNSLFNEYNETKGFHVGSKIVSVSISNYENYLPSPIPILYRSKHGRGTQCAYWNFDDSLSQSSNWIPDNTSTVDNNDWENLTICAFTHLTHFALLVRAEDAKLLQEGDVEYYDALGAITNVESIISVIGILGIFITAIIFDNWRKRIGTKILLNLSACILLQLIALYLSDMTNVEKNRGTCIVIGALLHYSVLAVFYWMLLTACLQYFRFVRVIYALPSRVLLKSCIVGWAAPGVIVALTLLINSDSYMPDLESSFTLCYPRGNYFYCLVLFPVGVIVFVNLGLFCVIMYNVSTSPVRKYTARKEDMTVEQLKLAVLLFFLLGLTWIFGLLATTGVNAFLYLFCLTATLQGFMLFVFYVLVDRSTRKLWLELLGTWCVRLQMYGGKAMQLTEGTSTTSN